MEVIKMELLGKTRMINAMLQQAAGKPVNFKEMAETLRNVIESNVFVLSRKGKLLGSSLNQEIENDRIKSILEEKQFPPQYTQKLFQINETSANLDINSEFTAFPEE